MINKICIVFVVSFLFIGLFFSSCNDKSNSKSLSTETMDSGKVEVFCDESYSFALDTVFKMYAERYKKVELKINFVNARNVVSNLLGGQTRVAIVGRDYLLDEDSLMDSYNVSPYYQMDIANDGLVFFTQTDFPIDTVNEQMLIDKFTGNKKIRENTTKLEFEPEFVIAQQNSSEYGNFMNLVCKKEKILHSPLLLPNSDSVIDYVKNNPKSIGICYLSQIQGKFFKLLRVGYTDKDGNYIKATKVPHQSFIVMGEYPYTTLIRLYLLEDRKNLPFWFGAFVEKENSSVNHYQQVRLVPCYAKYNLEDERRPKR